jgi:hypothetical protein
MVLNHPIQGRRHETAHLREGAAMDTRRTERLAERARALAARAEADDSTGADLLVRAEEVLSRANRARAGAAWVRDEFEVLRRSDLGQ